jgi:hypothetical protein
MNFVFLSLLTARNECVPVPFSPPFFLVFFSLPWFLISFVLFVHYGHDDIHLFENFQSGTTPSYHWFLADVSSTYLPSGHE